MFSERNTSGPLALFLFPDFKFWTALRNVPLHMSRDTHSEFSHQEIHSRLESIPRKRRDITHARLLYSCSQLFLRPRLIAPRGQQSVSTTCTNHREPLSWILVDLHGPILSKFAMCGQILGKFPNMEFYEISSDGSRAVGTGTASGQDRQRDRWTVMTDLKYKTLKQNRHCERSEASSPGRSLTKPPGDHSVHMSTWYTAAQRLSRALSLSLSPSLSSVLDRCRNQNNKDYLNMNRKTQPCAAIMNDDVTWRTVSRIHIWGHWVHCQGSRGILIWCLSWNDGGPNERNRDKNFSTSFVSTLVT